MSLDSLILSNSVRSFLEEATSRYEANVNQAASYLIGRGLDQGAATGARLGVVSDPMPGHERFRGMVSIPYLTPAGVVAIKFRCAEPHDCKAEGHEKYNAPTGQKARLYGVQALHTKGDTVAIVEGEFSSIVMTHVVGIPTVGTPSTQWHDHWTRCFSDYERVLVIADNDLKPDGSNPGEKHAKKVVSAVPNARLILPPPGLDPDEWIQVEGADVVRKKVLGDDA